MVREIAGTKLAGGEWRRYRAGDERERRRNARGNNVRGGDGREQECMGRRE